MEKQSVTLPDHFGVVYVMAPDAEGPSKIGYTRNLQDRLMSLQTGCWLPLSIHHYRLCAFEEGGTRFRTLHSAFNAAGRAVERKAHAVLREMELGLHGEWFDVSPDEAIQVVDKCCRLVGARTLTLEDVASVDMRGSADFAFRAVHKKVVKLMAGANMYVRLHQPNATCRLTSPELGV